MKTIINIIQNFTQRKTFLLLGIFVTLFLIQPQATWAAVSHSAATESHTGTTGNTAAASFSWTHTEAGSPEGVLVFVTTVATNTDYITSVTYGGVTMTQVAEAADTATEPALMTAFFLGSGIPTGNQTVVVNRTNNATALYASAVTVQAAGDIEVTGTVLLQNNGTFAEQSVTDGSTGVDSMLYASAYYGGAAVLPAGANTTVLNSIDFGAYTTTLGRETTAGQGARSVGFTGATDDRAAVHLAVREVPPLYISGTLYTDFGSTTAGSGKTIKMAVGTSTPSVFSTTTTSTGFWEFSGVNLSTATSGTPITIWLDGDTDDATTLVAGYPGFGMSNIPLYYDYTIVSTKNSSDVVNPSTNLRFYDSADDSDILYTVNSSTSTTIVGSFFVQRGNFTAPSGTLSISGNYKNDSIFSAGTGEVVLTGTSKTIDGILSATSTFYNLTIEGTYTVATTTASTTNLTITVGGSFTAPSGTLSVQGNFENAGTFNDNGGLVLVDTSYISGYLGGVDADASLVGTEFGYVNGILVRDSYMYVATKVIPNACSQTAGSAEGCELQVYDISNPASPVYVAGRDMSGSASGTGAEAEFLSLAISGNYLYIGTSGYATTCSQTAGSAHGCELQVYDISSSTNPVYVAGRDGSGSADGATYTLFYDIEIVGNYLYAAASGVGTACSQIAGSAGDCELQVYDISSSTNPTYVAGRDIDGSATGTTDGYILTLSSAGNTLYAGNSASSTACSQTAGVDGVVGCELQVYDISSSTNPVYVAGRDSDGSATGVYPFPVMDIQTDGSYLYLGKQGDGTQCSQTVGTAGAAGCELQVYDISSSTNPVYVAGRDADTGADGIYGGGAGKIVISNNVLIRTISTNDIPCSQIAGSAIGCEIQIYDISSSTNPLYVAGMDSDGTSSGTEYGSAYASAVYKNYLIIGKSAGNESCSSVPGLAIGCELMTFQLSPSFSGEMTAGNAFASLTVGGAGIVFTDDVSANNFIIDGGTVVAPAVLSVTDSFTNNSNFNANGGEVVLLGNEHTLTGTTTFFDLTKNATAAATTTFEAGSLFTVAGEWNFSGIYTAPHKLRSSVADAYWYVDPQATTSLSYLDVKDSNNTNVSAVVCGTGCINSTNNINWSFTTEGAPQLASEAPYHFYVGQSTTTLPAMTITEAATSSITAVNDILLSIDTAVTNFRFNQGTSNLSFGGTAAAKVSTSVFYEEEGATMRIDVLENFAASDTLVISGVTVGSFASVSTTTSAFELHTDDTTEGAPAALDTASIRITGSLLVGEHPEGQVNNQFDFQNHNDEPLFAFTLESVSEEVAVTDMVITLSGIQNIDTTDLSDFRLYRDTNADEILDGGDVLIDGAGILTISGQYGAVTFSADFTATSSVAYFVTADTTTIELGASVVFQLMSTGITSTGDVSLYGPVVLITTDSIQHFRRGGSAGGSSSRIGELPVPGAGVVTGGESGAGSEVGEGADGENIAVDLDYYKPTSTGSSDNEWTNGVNALTSDGVYATAASAGLRQSFAGFTFNIPSGNTIQGIAVKLDASGTTADGTIDVAVSWNAGSSFTTVKATPTLVGTDVVYLIGGNADLWGRSWTAAEFSPENFRLRVIAQPAANTIRLDALEIRVYHQIGGGGSGGGGGSSGGRT